MSGLWFKRDLANSYDRLYPYVFCYSASRHDFTYAYLTRKPRLKVAGASGDQSLIQHALTLGADDYIDGIESACLTGRLQLVRQLTGMRGSVSLSKCRGAFIAACRSGNRELIDYVMLFATAIYDLGLLGACQGGHTWLIDYLAQQSEIPLNWEWGLFGACESDRVDIAQLMISRLKHIPHHAFGIACKYNSTRMISMLTDLGVTDWYAGFTEACHGGHFELAKQIYSSHPNSDYLPVALQKAIVSHNPALIDWVESLCLVEGVLPTDTVRMAITGACEADDLPRLKRYIDMAECYTENCEQGLYQACRLGHYEIAEYIINHAPSIDVFIHSAMCDGLGYAQDAKRHRLIALLKKHGARVVYNDRGDRVVYNDRD